jgi:hypothetical protein
LVTHSELSSARRPGLKKLLFTSFTVLSIAVTVTVTVAIAIAASTAPLGLQSWRASLALIS